MWLIGVSVVLVVLVVGLLGLRRWFDRMQDARAPRDDGPDEVPSAVTSSTIYISSNGRL